MSDNRQLSIARRSRGSLAIPGSAALCRRTWRFLRRTSFLLFALSPFCILLPSSTGAEEYVLGPQDKVRVKVYEWRASRDVIFEWSALNDEFTVGAEGRLSLPFAGEVEAAGLTLEEVSTAIGENLKKNMGLGRRPDSSIEVIGFRPFYILGHVSEPGEFPYRPGLTVLQAVSVAGGLRVWEQDLARFRREIIQGRGNVNALALERVGLLARKARLEAEMAGAREIAFPDQLAQRSTDQAIAHAMNQERQIFGARKEALSTQVQALESLRSFLEKELSTLRAQLGFLDKQIGLIEKEADNVSSLVTKGLAPESREMSLERTLAQLQSERLTAETSLLRTQQEISRTEVNILELRNQRTNDITVALRQTQAELDALDHKAETALRLLHDSEDSAPRIAASLAGMDAVDAAYKIIRPMDTGTITLAAEVSTRVKPGDTVQVSIPIPTGLEKLGASLAEPAHPLGRPLPTAEADF